MRTGSIWTYLKNQVKYSGIAGKLILVNLVIFLVLNLIKVINESAFAQVYGFLIAPTDLSELAYRPWTAITNFFTHDDLGHFFFNMLALFLLARLYISFFGERRLLLPYFLGGLFAYFIHVAATYIFMGSLVSGHGYLLGASGSVMAIFFAAAVYRPRFQVHFFGVFPVPLIGLAAVYLLLDLAGIAGESDPNGPNVAYFAHLGGALFGALSVWKADSRKNLMYRLEQWTFKFKWKLPNFKRTGKTKMKVYKNKNRNKKAVSEMTDLEYNSKKNADQERINAILDKISEKGYNGLTKEEKEILFNESKR